ncbi:MAG TPA: heavy metal translocating P-type ATPase, partial [Symbiobacteriaceae bacterium]|nr:heavy metal translocating P-type ATPase [Symbiobacteriaceae bacterium]
GIAMGGVGSDVAMETADVVLMADELEKIAEAIGLARRSRSIIMQNLSFAVAVILTLVSLVLFGDLNLPLAVVGHEGSTILVAFNGLRLLVTRLRVR